MSNKYINMCKIGYRDVDSFLNLKPASLLYLFQEASMFHSESVGAGVRELFKKRLAWVSLGWNIKIYKMPTYLEEVQINTWSNSPTGVYAMRQFEMVNKAGERMAVAEDKFVLIDIEKQRITRKVDVSAYKNEINEERTIEEEFPKLKENDVYSEKYNFNVQLRDIDTNMHMNNIKYLEYALESIPYEKHNKISQIHINYKHELKYPEEIHLCKEQKDDKYKFSFKDSQDEMHALIEMYVR